MEEMKKRFRIVFAVLLVAIGLAWLLLPAHEPSYNGKPFSIWLEKYSPTKRDSDPTEEEKKAIKALSQMGAEAVPIILRTLEKNDSPMVNKYREAWPTLPAIVKRILPRPKPEAFSMHDAVYAFGLLPATNITPQLPSLIKSHNPAVREVAFGSLLSLRERATLKDGANPFSDEELLSNCTAALNDSSAMVRLYSALVMCTIGPAASNAVPALIVALQGSEAGRHKNSFVSSRAAAANALGRIGPAAASSVPALTNLLPSANSHLKVQIAGALWQITSEESMALPLLISECPKLEGPSKYGAINPLIEMGARAKAAVPMLLNELTSTNNDHYILELVTNALKTIDPEAAAKAGVK